MADDTTLSRQQVDTVLEGIDAAASPNTPRDPANTPQGKRIRAFDPASQQRVVRGRLHTFDIINARFARRFRMSLFNLLRRNADISVSGVNIQKYGDFTHELPDTANINIVAMAPLRGNALVVFPSKLVYMVVESLFGGDGRFVTNVGSREFTHTEQRIIQRLLALALDSYAAGWQEIYPIEPQYQRAEMHARFANIVNTSNEPVVTTRFHLEVGNFGSDFYICIPYATLDPIRELLSGPLQKKDPEEQRARTRRLAAQVKNSSVTLVADFAQIATTLGRVQTLRVGDVLALSLPGEITARVDGVPVFKCAYGRINDRKALRVARLIDHIEDPAED